MKQLQQILQLTRSHHRRLYLAVFVNLILTALMLVPPYMTKLLIDQVYPNQDETLLYLVIFSTALFSISTDLITHIKGYYVQFLNLRLSLGTNFEFYRHVSTMDMEFYSRRKIGDISSRAKDALESVGGIMQIANSFIMNFVTLVIFPPILWYINWKLALLALAVIPSDLIISFLVSKYTAVKTRQIASLNSEVNAKKIEFLAGMSTIQALGIETNLLEGIKATALESAQIKIKLSFLQKTAAFLAHSIRAIGILFYSGYGWTKILSGDLSLGTYLAFTAYSGYLIGPIKGLIGLASKLRVLSVHIDRFIEIYAMEPKTRSPLTPIKGWAIEGNIEFKEVSFAYDSGKPTLAHLNLSIEAGKTYGIVGSSGTGKTTLIQLIPRFYDPTLGRIEIDGKDIRALDLQTLRQHISYMQQDAFIFSGSISNNILIGNPNADQTAVEKAARKACIHDFIISLEQGYDTQVGERGNRLSQGQKQRLALARVLVRKSPIIILDEATSALDIETEKQLLTILQTELSTSTTILITHRTSALKTADLIAVLHQGAIQEQDTYHELVKKENLFAEIHSKSPAPTATS